MKILHVTHSRDAVGDTGRFIGRLNSGLEAAGDKSVVADEKTPVPDEKWDIIHIHGLWRSFHRAATVFARENAIPVVRSVYGGTSHWNLNRKWLTKFIPWNLYQKKDLEKASLIHSMSDEEVERMRELDIDCNYAVIPFGTDIPEMPEAEMTPKSAKTFLFAASAHPVNGLDELLRAWKMCRHGDWKLRIACTDGERHLSRVQKTARTLGLADVDFAVIRNAPDIEREYASCDCFVYPSFDEYDGGSVARALARGKPCIASRYTPWRILDAEKCGWWRGNRPKALAEVMQEVMSLDDGRLAEYGAKARELAQKRFAWERVVEKMRAAYAGVLAHRRHEKEYSWR